MLRNGYPERETARTVSELTRLIRTALESAFPAVCVEGEVSNLRAPASGHLYFTLKDEGAQIPAVVWRGTRRALRVEPRDGMALRVWGDVTVYERGGQYQLAVRQADMKDAKGDLLKRFEALKAKLQAEGLFDLARKRPLPMLPRRIGVVTSPSGAAIRDILKVFAGRFPNLHILIAPARVQGEGAALEIAAGIERLNRFGGVDVIIVGRGGGSLEDLWCFNEEPVARAIAASRVPVISAVGHETDFTISDFAADLRAPTPSAAAEQVVGRKADLEARLAAMRRRLEMGLRVRAVWRARIDGLARRLHAGVRETGRAARARFAAAAGRPAWRAPGRLLDARRDGLRRIEQDLRRGLRERARRAAQHADALAWRLARAAKGGLDQARERTARREAQLRALNPLAILTRGYSVTLGAEGRVVKSVADARPGDRLRTRVADGIIASEVKADHDT